MDLISLLVVVLVFCLILWIIERYMPIDPPFKTIIIVVVALVFIIYLLRSIGIVSI